MAQKLKLAQDMVNELQTERAHKMGPTNKHDVNGTKQTSKIVCKFTSSDREIVRKAKNHLRDTKYYIHKQFSQAIIAKTKKQNKNEGGDQ